MLDRIAERCALCLLMAGMAAGCVPASDARSSTGLQGKLVITGSSTCAPLVAEIGKRFETLHPGVRVDVQSGGSSRGITDARRGTADLARIIHEGADSFPGSVLIVS